jgi:hypothetical protein
VNLDNLNFFKWWERTFKPKDSVRDEKSFICLYTTVLHGFVSNIW